MCFVLLRVLCTTTEGFGVWVGGEAEVLAEGSLHSEPIVGSSHALVNDKLPFFGVLFFHCSGLIAGRGVRVEA